MSLMSFGWSTAKSTESSPPRSRIASGMSLWPSMSGTVLRIRRAWARKSWADRRTGGRADRKTDSTSAVFPTACPAVRQSALIRAQSCLGPCRLSSLRFACMPPSDAKVKIAFELNGEPVEVAFAPHKTLLEVLREDLALTGTKHGCELGECGTCTVLLDGTPVLSCLVLGLACEGRRVKTVEGLAQGSRLHPLQEAFAALGAAQCGYCTPAFLLTADALLTDNPSPSRDEIKQALSGNLCRCTGYIKIYEAVELAAARLRGERAEPTRESLYGSR